MCLNWAINREVVLSWQEIWNKCFNQFVMKLQLHWIWKIVACENIHFSSLFAAGDVSRGGTVQNVPSGEEWGQTDVYFFHQNMGIDNTDIGTKPQLISPPLFCPTRTVILLVLLVAVRTVLSSLTLHCELIKDTTFLSFHTVPCSCFTCSLTQFAHILCL